MKHLYLKVVLLLLVANTSFSQVNTTSGTYEPIGDVTLTTVYDDADNGDGIGDGAIFVDGNSSTGVQGAIFTFGGVIDPNEELNVSIYTYNRNSSFVKFRIQLFNATTNTILVTSQDVFHNGNDTTPINTVLSYTPIIDDGEGVLQARFIRTDDGSTSRNFAIDNITLSGPCPFTVTPDLALIPSNDTIDAEINTAVNRFSDAYLGTSAPSSAQLASAESAYAALNINVSGGTITGNPISSFNSASFLKTFAKHLKFNPGDSNIQTKTNNAVWLISKQFCAGDLAMDNQLYAYEDFARPTVLLKDFLEPNVKSLFAYSLYRHSVAFEHFWEPTYDESYQEDNNAINTDQIFNIGDVFLAYSLWQDTADERYRYMRAYKRYMNRFFSYSAGTSEGIKIDGSGFHHLTAYNNYMYAYNTAANILSYLSGTDFQVDQANYEVFRNAFYAQFIQANDAGVQAFSTAGRNPQNRTRPLSLSSLKTIAIAGGDILGLSTADPIFAGMYNRINGVSSDFDYTAVTPFEEGFFQFNHASAGVFRKDGWLVFNKGFTNNMWGSEIYVPQNRYGRYQSYGAQEIIYPGNKLTGNGYDVDTWNWNYNPGTTVIRLPWAKLHAERGRLDELQQKRFAGALKLSTTNSELLTNNHGEYGMFAMDFQEMEGQGFGTTHASENHNNTFTFKKSNFYFDDIIVCLGSGISNDDASNETITTLYQRLDNAGTSPRVNGADQTSSGEVSFDGASNNWVLSNYNTGFYLLSGDYSLKVKKELQQTPNQNQIWPVDFSGNPTATYYTAYLDHGTNPSNKSYEYILMPDSNPSEMETLGTEIQGGNKPYSVHQQNANAHIVEHKAKDVWGYAIFNAVSNLTYDKVTAVNASCLVMTEYNDSAETLVLSVVNPDIGFEVRSYKPSVPVTRQITLQGEWGLSQSYPGVSVLSSSETQTVLGFNLVDGLSKEVLLQSASTMSVDDKVLNDNHILVYPNPTDSILNIQISDANIQIIHVSLIDISGKLIYSSGNTNTIQVSDFAKGLYFLSLETKTGQMINKKVIVK